MILLDIYYDISLRRTQFIGKFVAAYALSIGYDILARLWLKWQYTAVCVIVHIFAFKLLFEMFVWSPLCFFFAFIHRTNLIVSVSLTFYLVTCCCLFTHSRAPYVTAMFLNSLLHWGNTYNRASWYVSIFKLFSAHKGQGREGHTSANSDLFIHKKFIFHAFINLIFMKIS